MMVVTNNCLANPAHHIAPALKFRSISKEPTKRQHDPPPSPSKNALRSKRAAGRAVQSAASLASWPASCEPKRLQSSWLPPGLAGVRCCHPC